MRVGTKISALAKRSTEKSRSLSRAQSVAAATSLALLRDDKGAKG